MTKPELPEWIERIQGRNNNATHGKQEARTVQSGMPSDCCHFAVISLETGKETMRCWTSEDALSYATLHNDRSNLLEHCMKLREALDNFKNAFETLPEDPDVFDLEPAYQKAYKALQHKPEGIE